MACGPFRQRYKTASERGPAPGGRLSLIAGLPQLETSYYYLRRHAFRVSKAKAHSMAWRVKLAPA